MVGITRSKVILTINSSGLEYPKKQQPFRNETVNLQTQALQVILDQINEVLTSCEVWTVHGWRVSTTNA